MRLRFLVLLGFAALCGSPASAQRAPEVGYVYPPSVPAGATSEVVLAGYDWTPDLQYFVHHPQVKLEVAPGLSPMFVTPPPYWSGAKTYAPAIPMAREVKAKITVPADLPTGPIRWQVANANGSSSAGILWVSNGTEIQEVPHRREPQSVDALPTTVCGRVSRISEVDRYRFTANRSGPVTCELFARRLGSRFNGVLEVRDSSGRVVADWADTLGRDGSLTFRAEAGATYTVGVHDLDFNGDRAFVYRLAITPGSKVLATVPACGTRGQTQEVTFHGMGLATGGEELETTTRRVAFPREGGTFAYRLETEHAGAIPVVIPLTDLTETAEIPGQVLTVNSAITGTLSSRSEVDRYPCSLKKGETLSLDLQAREIGSDLDVSLALHGPDGKQMVRSDDRPGTTDTGFEITIPADGTYELAVCAMGGWTPGRPTTYRLAVRGAQPDFRLETPQRLSLLIGGKAELTVKAQRLGGFAGPIALKVEGLPEGVTVPADLSIPAGKAEVKIPFQAVPDAAAWTHSVRISGTGVVDAAGRTLAQTVAANAGGNLAPLSPGENELPVVLVSTIMKPLWKVEPVDKDGGRTVHRGTTYPAEVIVTRINGFTGPIELQMEALQARHVMGIWGPDLPVPADVTRIHYPCFMPEWLETSRTSRMNLVAVGKVADPRGNLRYLMEPMDGRITMSMEGALLKVTHEAGELTPRPGDTLEVPVKVVRSAKLPESVRLELRQSDGMSGLFTAEPLTLSADQTEATLKITVSPQMRERGRVPLVIRATAMQSGTLPAISETTVDIYLTAPPSR